MNTIVKKDSVIFILPFKMKYFYLYNDEYFKTRNIHATISVLLKSNADNLENISADQENIVKGGGEVEEKTKTLSVPYKYVYYVMERIRNSLPSLSRSTSQQTSVSDEKVFTTYLDQNKKEINETPKNKTSFFKTFNPFALFKTPSYNEDKLSADTTNADSPAQLSSIAVEEVFENIPPDDMKTEQGELKEIDITKKEDLEKNSENLLFKIEIFGNVKKMNIENKEYVEREKIVDEIFYNNSVGGNESNQQQEENNKVGGVYEVDGKIIVIGELGTDDINKLKDKIEGTELYNKFLQ